MSPTFWNGTPPSPADGRGFGGGGLPRSLHHRAARHRGPVASDSEDQRLVTVIAWAREHPDHHVAVDMLAARALMSRAGSRHGERLTRLVGAGRGGCGDRLASLPRGSVRPRQGWRGPLRVQ